MRLSRESEYGLEGLRVLASQPPGKVMLLREIAAMGHLPERFLAKIFHKLARHRVVVPHRGAIRGYSLAKSAGMITVREIVEAIEGPSLFQRCVFWPGRCGLERPCRLHEGWAGVRSSAERILDGITLERIASSASPERPRPTGNPSVS